YRGDKLVYIGERGEGATGSLRFHRELALNWSVEEEARLPNWPRLRDTLTVYRRNRVRQALRERDRCFECHRFIATGASGLLLGGFGMGLTMTPVTAAAMSAVAVDKAGIGYVRYENSLLAIDDLEAASKLCDHFAHRAWPRVLNAFARLLNPLLGNIAHAGYGGYYWELNQA
ncbi:MAG: hypothetical protein ABR607_17460, partial [Pyrinomonadaceae bacterium]